MRGEIGSLVAVACHAVYVGGGLDDLLDDASWGLEEFQKGEPRYLVEHIRRAVVIASGDPGALLVFSGGPTREAAGPQSEARGYLRIADHNGWWSREGVRDRAVAEEFARDSFENLLFSICRFRERTGCYPARITVVSWGFKRERFDHHREALRFPPGRFTFVGVNDPEDLEAAMEGERRRGLGPFLADPYGCGEILSSKRRDRNPFEQEHAYARTCPEVADLLGHAGPGLFEGPLPWDK